MKLQFRHQKFQADAATAVCDVFAGQPFQAPTYRIDPGLGQIDLYDGRQFTGFNNAPVAIGDDKVLEHIRAIQRAGQIKPSDALDGRYNLTVEMETGVGKPIPTSRRCMSSISGTGGANLLLSCRAWRFARACISHFR